MILNTEIGLKLFLSDSALVLKIGDTFKSFPHIWEPTDCDTHAGYFCKRAG